MVYTNIITVRLQILSFFLFSSRTEKFKYKRAAQYFGEFICLLVVAVMVMKNFIRPSFLALPEDPPRYKNKVFATSHTYVDD